MRESLNWKEVGQFLAVLWSLFAVIYNTFKEALIGIEIIPWLITDGKDFFIDNFLKPLGEEFLKNQRIRVLSDTTIMVNLDAAPKLPFDGAQIEKNDGGGWVKVEKRKDELYVDGRKVIMRIVKRQKNGKTIRGYELHDELSGELVLHPNILDALIEQHLNLIPKKWRSIGLIFFWGVIFRSPDGGGLFVRYIFWRGSGCSWLGRDFDSDDPAAVCAS